ncbi:MAG: hemerythrin domain-containing protein [Myxococcota bacterium]
MTLTDILRREHDLITRALDVLRGVSDAPDAPGAQHAAERLVAFFRDFADGAHHAREEGALFPALQSRGLPREGGPVGCMLREHDEGRRLVGHMARCVEVGLVDRESREAFREAARDYAILLGQHIFKENHVLFDMADRVLPPELAARLGADHRESHEAAMEAHANDIAELARRFLSAEPVEASAGEHADEHLGHHVRQ